MSYGSLLASGMKRNASLVDYESSGEDEESFQTTYDLTSASTSTKPPAKKPRKLPPIGAHLQPQLHVDNPALHQGRRRTMAHVEGQYAAYVYVPILITETSRLSALLRRIYSAAKFSVPTLQPIGSTEVGVSPFELHISLTRPIFLRAHQREEFKRAVRSVTKEKLKFPASFATCSELTNDERTRTFLTLEIGAGHDNLKDLVEKLSPALRAIRQKVFYEEPRFHASIAWALLHNAKTQSSPPNTDDTTSETLPPTAMLPDQPTADDEKSSVASKFPTISQLPPSLIPYLRKDFCNELVQRGVGNFEVEEVHARIGKQISKWRLSE